MDECDHSSQVLLDGLQKSSFEQPTILLVDDQPLNLQILNDALSLLYHIKITKSGRTALKLAQALKPDLILLDVMMPEMDGYHVCRELKRSEATRDIPVIFVTGEDSQENEVKGLSLGAVDYITKPFSLPIVEARIKTHLKLKRQNDLLNRLATLDGLTGIPNRRLADNILHQEWQRAQRIGHDISIGIVDVDYFKLFNDCYGHAEGDRCLQLIASALLKHMSRSGDFVARFGGEEFLFVLPKTPLKGAQKISDELRKNIIDLAIPHEQSLISDYITLSIGVICATPKPSQQVEQVIEMADKQLYKAKRGGRNQTSAAWFDYKVNPMINIQ